jgi:hypothetical protein
MKNITITLDEKTAAWARVRAAEKNTSVSRMVGEMLQKQMREASAYDEAHRQWRLAVSKARAISQPGQRYPIRDEIYDRPGLRRR